MQVNFKWNFFVVAGYKSHLIKVYVPLDSLRCILQNEIGSICRSYVVCICTYTYIGIYSHAIDDQLVPTRLSLNRVIEIFEELLFLSNDPIEGGALIVFCRRVYSPIRGAPLAVHAGIIGGFGPASKSGFFQSPITNIIHSKLGKCSNWKTFGRKSLYLGIILITAYSRI